MHATKNPSLKWLRRWACRKSNALAMIFALFFIVGMAFNIVRSF